MEIPDLPEGALPINYTALHITEQHSQISRAMVECFAIVKNRPSTHDQLDEAFRQIHRKSKSLPTGDLIRTSNTRMYKQQWQRAAEKNGVPPVIHSEDSQCVLGDEHHRVCKAKGEVNGREKWVHWLDASIGVFATGRTVAPLPRQKKSIKKLSKKQSKPVPTSLRQRIESSDDDFVTISNTVANTTSNSRMSIPPIPAPEPSIHEIFAALHTPPLPTAMHLWSIAPPTPPPSSDSSLDSPQISIFADDLTGFPFESVTEFSALPPPTPSIYESSLFEIMEESPPFDFVDSSFVTPTVDNNVADDLFDISSQNLPMDIAQFNSDTWNTSSQFEFEFELVDIDALNMILGLDAESEAEPAESQVVVDASLSLDFLFE